MSMYTDMYKAIKSVPIVRARTAYNNPKTMSSKTIRTLCFRRNMPGIHRAFGFSKASRTVDEREISRVIGAVSVDRKDNHSDDHKKDGTVSGVINSDVISVSLPYYRHDIRGMRRRTLD